MANCLLVHTGRFSRDLHATISTSNTRESQLAPWGISI